MLDMHLQLVKSKKYLHDRNKMYRNFPTTFNNDLMASIDENNPPAITDGAMGFQATSIPWLTECEFQQKYRLTRQSFDVILGMIKDHPQFTQHKKVGRPQAPPENQLMVLLKYLGTEGGGASNSDLRNLYYIGRGTANLYKKRTMLAIRSLLDKAITCPDEEERQQIADRIQQRHLFPNCVGFINGTLFPLANSPQSIDAPDYSGRNMLIVYRSLLLTTINVLFGII
jgi:hypothetical protein